MSVSVSMCLCISCRCAEDKLHFTPVHTLRQLKRYRGMFPLLLIGLADWNGLKNLPRQTFSACVKFGGNPCRDVDTLGFYTHTHTQTHTHTHIHEWNYILDLWKAVTFFVLHPIRVKFHIRTRLIESFPTMYWLWCCAEEKWHLTPVHTLRQLKRDEALFPPLRISLADRNGLRTFPGKFLVRVWRLVAIRAEMLTHFAFTHTQTDT